MSAKSIAASNSQSFLLSVGRDMVNTQSSRRRSLCYEVWTGRREVLSDFRAEDNPIPKMSEPGPRLRSHCRCCWSTWNSMNQSTCTSTSPESKEGHDWKTWARIRDRNPHLPMTGGQRTRLPLVELSSELAVRLEAHACAHSSHPPNKLTHSFTCLQHSSLIMFQALCLFWQLALLMKLRQSVRVTV